MLKATGITKRFGGIQALNGVDFEVTKGEVHALMGENGAGKSTLVKILTGVYQKDEGRILFDGSELTAKSPSQCLQKGIGIVFQEPTLIQSLDVKTNIFLGRYPPRKVPGVVNWQRLRRDTSLVLEELGVNINPDTLVGDLTFGKRQMIEIAKVIAHNAKLIILDEPTSALSDEEKDSLFRAIARLKQKGTSIIYISHRLPEIFEITDRVTVMRDGRYIGTEFTSILNSDSLIKMMVGRTLEAIPQRDGAIGSENILQVNGLGRGKVLKDIGFSLRKGELLGVFGLVGSGRTEMARALLGIDRIDSGEIWLDGQKVVIRSPVEAVKLGLGFVPESRKEHGIIPLMSSGLNITLSVLNRCSTASIINWDKQENIAQGFIKKLGIKVSGLNQPVVNLSGGNQQKVVVAKWLASNPRILILDEPTRGIDVGSKAEIHNLIIQLINEGLSVIMISSEMEEVMKLSDRVLVLYEGRVTGILNREDLSEENLLKSIHGHLHAV